MIEQQVIHFKHNVGDGVHYITDNFKVFNNGEIQYGDTSDVCILLNLEIVLSHNTKDLSVPDLWNAVYPNDPMSDDDMGYISFSAIDYCEDFDAKSLDNIASVLDDLRRMGCPELAEYATTALQDAGVSI